MQPYRIIGIDSSPYAVKVRAVFRYRRIPHIWVARMPQFFDETAHVKPLIMPVIQYPDGEYRTDSTPVILDLEERHPGGRSILPADPGQAFLAMLVEDFADEWLTKCLFHYRFDLPEDQWAGAAWVMDDAYPGMTGSDYEERVKDFIARQVARRELVGCTPENAPLFEESYADVLDALESFAATDRCLFGTRPSLADFGLYGQLHTLTTDPTPRAIAETRAPRTVHWVNRLHDASGVEGAWEEPVAAVETLLGLAGRYYLPYLAANRATIEAGEPELVTQLAGKPYRQPVFRYQAKCYDFLRRQFEQLPEVSQDSIEPLLGRTGCLPWLRL